MFDRYFCPRVAARLRANPDADWLGSFLESLDRRGLARLTVQDYLRGAELFGRWLRRRHLALAEVTDADVQTFVGRGARKAIPPNACSAGVKILVRGDGGFCRWKMMRGATATISATFSASHATRWSKGTRRNGWPK